MFMSRGELFHESSWALWFQHAAGLLPVSALQADPGEPSEPLMWLGILATKAMFRQAVRDQSSVTRCLDNMEEHTSMQVRWFHPVSAKQPVLRIKARTQVHVHDCTRVGCTRMDISTRNQVSQGYHTLPCTLQSGPNDVKLPCKSRDSHDICADGAEAHCSAERLQLAQQYCSDPQSVAVLQRQHMFSVYMHPLPSFGAFPEESIFHGREIQDRIQVWLTSCQ